jgi:hypothetical protein
MDEARALQIRRADAKAMWDRKRAKKGAGK